MSYGNKNKLHLINVNFQLSTAMIFLEYNSKFYDTLNSLFFSNTWR